MKLYKAIKNGDEGVFKCPRVFEDEQNGYKLVNKYFVDNSGFGASDEPALTASKFLDKVKAGLFYAISNAGQFQVYINEYEKTKRTIDPNKTPIKRGIKNQWLIKDGLVEYFKSYGSIIAKKDGGKVILDPVCWNYSRTTSRYRCIFLQETRIETEKKIKAGTYKLENLNA